MTEHLKRQPTDISLLATNTGLKQGTKHDLCDPMVLFLEILQHRYSFLESIVMPKLSRLWKLKALHIMFRKNNTISSSSPTLFVISCRRGAGGPGSSCGTSVASSYCTAPWRNKTTSLCLQRHQQCFYAARPIAALDAR